MTSDEIAARTNAQMKWQKESLGSQKWAQVVGCPDDPDGQHHSACGCDDVDPINPNVQYERPRSLREALVEALPGFHRRTAGFLADALVPVVTAWVERQHGPGQCVSVEDALRHIAVTAWARDDTTMAEVEAWAAGWSAAAAALASAALAAADLAGQR